MLWKSRNGELSNSAKPSGAATACCDRVGEDYIHRVLTLAGVRGSAGHLQKRVGSTRTLAPSHAAASVPKMRPAFVHCPAHRYPIARKDVTYHHGPSQSLRDCW